MGQITKQLMSAIREADYKVTNEIILTFGGMTVMEYMNALKEVPREDLKSSIDEYLDFYGVEQHKMAQGVA